jgi:hypothetical protein
LIRGRREVRSIGDAKKIPVFHRVLYGLGELHWSPPI